MAANDLTPSFVRIFYTSGGTPHVQTLQVALESPVTPGNEPEFITRDGFGVTATTGVGAWIAVAKTAMHTSTTYTGFEVYYYPDPDGDPVFVFGADLNVPGTNAVSPVQNGQGVFSFGTAAGGLLKLYLMEPSIAVDQRIPLRASSPGLYGVIATYVLGSGNWILGRDDAQPIRGIYFTSKINDTLRKKQLLDQ